MRTVILRVDRRPAEDDAYDIGAIVVPDDIEWDDLQERIDRLWEEWRSEWRNGDAPDSDGDFLVWLVRHGHFQATEPPDVMIVGWP